MVVGYLYHHFRKHPIGFLWKSMALEVSWIHLILQATWLVPGHLAPAPEVGKRKWMEMMEVPKLRRIKLLRKPPVTNWVVVSKIFYFQPYLGKWSNLTNIFQVGWNHQLARCLIDQGVWLIILCWICWIFLLKITTPENQHGSWKHDASQKVHVGLRGHYILGCLLPLTIWNRFVIDLRSKVLRFENQMCRY